MQRLGEKEATQPIEFTEISIQIQATERIWSHPLYPTAF